MLNFKTFFDMTQSFQLSSDVRNIINKFNDSLRASGKFNVFNKVNILVVSLYALQEDARKDVLDILNHYVENLSSYLSTDEITTLLANYPDVVKSAMFDSQPNTISANGWCSLPIEIPQLCQALARCSEKSKVFFPYAGDAILATGLPESCQISGFEKDPEMWAVANIYLHSLGFSANLLLGDKVDREQQYDYIFCFPPMIGGADGRNVKNSIFDLIRNNLATDGEMYCILPDNFCYDTSGWFEVRKIPFDSHDEYSTMVISLPDGLLHSFSGIKLCLFHIKRNCDNKVLLVNAHDESFLAHSGIKEGNRRETIKATLKVDSILDTIKTLDEDYVWTGNIHQLFDLSHDLDMTPRRYISVIRDVQLAPGEKLVALKDIVEFLPKTRIANAPTMIPTIGMRELSFNYLNCELVFDKIPVEARTGNGNRAITCDCLLMGFVGGKFKVARLKGVSASRPVFLKSEVVAFKISSDTVNEDFLLRCITGEFVSKQANALAVGATITRLKPNDFQSLDVIIPSLEEQKRLYIEDTRQGISDADRKVLENYEEFRKDMHMKKHALGQTIFNIKNWWGLLLKARENGNGIVDDSADLGKSRKIKVSEIYDNLQNAISKLNMQLSKFDVGYGLSSENIALADFIEQYIRGNKMPQFEFVYDAAAHRAPADLPEID